MTGRKISGFTLIELIITVAIVGILAAIAYPSYTSQMQQTRRADCEGVLMQLAGAMERDFSRNNQYRDIITAGAFTANQCPLDGGTATYNLSVNPVTATTFQLNAVPVNAQATDSCGTLTLTNQMLKGSAGTPAQCWQ